MLSISILVSVSRKLNYKLKCFTDSFWACKYLVMVDAVRSVNSMLLAKGYCVCADPLQSRVKDTKAPMMNIGLKTCD